MTTLHVTGSRSLADTADARWWAVREILRALADLPLGSVVVTGDASGPDEWACHLLERVVAYAAVPHRALARVLFRRDGTTWTDTPYGETGRWCPPETLYTRDEWRTRLLARDRAMVARVAASEGERRCLALVAPWSKTRGASYTARHARDAGIATTVLECPREYGPEVTL